MYIRQNYRIYPNAEQKATLNQWLGQARFVWNYMLNKNMESYEKDKKFVFAYSMNNLLPDLKKQEETLWLSEIPSQCLQQKCQDLDTAIKASFKSKKNRKGFPKFKSKKTDESGIRFPKFRFDGNSVVLPKMKQGIKIKLHRPLLGIGGAGTIIRDKVGNYFISIIVQIEDVEKVAEIKNSIGLDLGLKEFAVTSDSEIIANPGFTKKAQKKISRSQRKHSKKQKQSNNREKSRVKLAKIYKKVTNQRKNFINQTASMITKENDLICIEDLHVKGMMKNHCLAKAIADVSWGEFITTLKWQAIKRGKHLVEINRYYPSSKTCSHCGEKKVDLTLADRVFKCDSCGFEIDRDLNASYNILNEGIKQFYTVGTTEIYARGDMSLEVKDSAREATSL